MWDWFTIMTQQITQICPPVLWMGEQNFHCLHWRNNSLYLRFLVSLEICSLMDLLRMVPKIKLILYCSIILGFYPNLECGYYTQQYCTRKNWFSNKYPCKGVPWLGVGTCVSFSFLVLGESCFNVFWFCICYDRLCVHWFINPLVSGEHCFHTNTKHLRILMFLPPLPHRSLNFEGVEVSCWNFVNSYN